MPSNLASSSQTRERREWDGPMGYGFDLRAIVELDVGRRPRFA
jgi:hypothetical protein